MAKGPKGQKRPTDVVSNAVKVMKIATGTDCRSPKCLEIKGSSVLNARNWGISAAGLSFARF